MASSSCTSPTAAKTLNGGQYNLLLGH
uniref:Uncharacterized protein n=1 Tax=Anguilla anguilla TaxID=7936 RepID=A0A0E9QIM0_ANGAN